MFWLHTVKALRPMLVLGGDSNNKGVVNKNYKEHICRGTKNYIKVTSLIFTNFRMW